jgi:hypothetical protein
MSAAHPASEAAIREQAYLLWEQEGRPHGREMEFWTRAEVALAAKPQMDSLTDVPPGRANANAAPRLKAAAMRSPASRGAKAGDKSKPRKK